MTEELDLNLEDLDQIDQNAEQKLQVKNRFQQLSEKVKTEAQGREEAETKFKVEAEGKAQAEKERDFFKNFSQLSSKYPSATSYQDQILAKVNSGYDVEDATLAILAKEGKLGVTNMPITESRPDNITGGSASTIINETGDKRPEEMSTDEKRNALLQMEKEGVNLLRL